MSFDEAAAEALAAAVVRAHDPAERFRMAICAALAARPPVRPPARPAATAPQRSSADLQAAYKAHQARIRAKYGDPAELQGRLQSRGGGLSARLWS